MISDDPANRPRIFSPSSYTVKASVNKIPSLLRASNQPILLNCHTVHLFDGAKGLRSFNGKLTNCLVNDPGERNPFFYLSITLS